MECVTTVLPHIPLGQTAEQYMHKPSVQFVYTLHSVTFRNNAPSSAPVAAKLQQDPHIAWSFTGVTAPNRAEEIILSDFGLSAKCLKFNINVKQMDQVLLSEVNLRPNSTYRTYHKASSPGSQAE